jgi:hypothetical protein
MMSFLEAVARHPWAALGVGAWALILVKIITSMVKACVALQVTRQRPPRLIPEMPPDHLSRALHDSLHAGGNDPTDDVRRGGCEQSAVARVN